MHRYTGSARGARQAAPPPRIPSSAILAALAPQDPPQELPWRETAALPLKRAAHVLGVSVASLYRLEQEGTLKFRRLCGRTLVRTEGVIALADADEPWSASQAGSAAHVKRAELAANGWKEVRA